MPDNADIDEKLGRKTDTKELGKYLLGWSLTEGGEILDDNEILITPENYNNLTLYGVWADKYKAEFYNENGNLWFSSYYIPGEVVSISYDDGAIERHYQKEHQRSS